ncbi:MAG TPA: YidC/Oxa1 family membrane protein insertase [Acidimicrobiales bacterium]|nr:YidC/Oxa1 family membrane protein insertase [Acidimicrobiales bacterium]
MLDGVFDLFANVLAWLYSWLHSYGFAITALTLVVMAITTPLTYKGTKSMLQMQRLQPQLKAIQARHKGDREKMNEELLKFYKANNINPVGGCLPLIIQMPVFFILFQVVQGLTRRVTNVGLQAGVAATDLLPGQGQLTRAESPLRDFQPKYISTDSQLYQDLSGTNRMKSWGLDMAESASKALTDSIGHALPYLLLIVGVLVTGIIQQRQIAGRNTSAQINPQQQMIMKLMPIFLPVFSFAMPAGLVVYFIVSNLWRIGQQAFITRKFYTGEHALGNLVAAARGSAVEEEPEVIETDVEATTKKTDGESAKPAVGRNRSTMARNSNRVGGRLRELDTKPAERKKPDTKPAERKKPVARQRTEKKGASEPAASPKFTSRRVTPKSGDGKGKRK